MIRRFAIPAIVAAVIVAASASEASPPQPVIGRGFSHADDPAWSPDGRKIAFIGHGPGVGTLYVMNADGSGVRQLTRSGFDAGWPSWSPDGRRIAFEHDAWGRHAGVYVVGADGSGLRKVVSGGEPAWGPGGKRIAFITPGRLHQHLVHTVSPDGTGVRLLADSRDECEVYIEPAWSPGGELIAFAATGAGGECGFRVFIGASRGGGPKVRVLAAGWFEQPDWSPDGKKIALVRYPPAPVAGKPYYTVGIFDLRTHRVRLLRAGWHPRWSPDGRELVFVRGDPFAPKPRSQIYLMNADGSNLRRLTP